MEVSQKKYVIRELQFEELPLLVALWKNIGFMVSAEYTEALWKTDRAGMIAAITDDGEIMGSCCSPLIGEGMAKVCMHGLMLQYRSQGLGTLLANKAMAHIGDTDAYIVCIPEHEHIYLNRYQFNVSPRVFQIMGPCIPKIDDAITSIPEIRVLESDRGVHEVLMEYDTDVVGFNRSAFLGRLLHSKNTMIRVAVREDNQIAGYGFIGDGVHGAAIVFHLSADTTDIAELLLGSLLRDFPGVFTKGVWVVGCIQNYETHNFFKKFNLKSIHELKLLRRRGVFDNDMSRVFVLY